MQNYTTEVEMTHHTLDYKTKLHYISGDDTSHLETTPEQRTILLKE